VDQEAAEAHVRQVFRDVLEQDYVESYEAQGAIGVAVLLTHLDAPLPDPDIVRVTEGIDLTVTTELRELAVRGLRRLQNPTDNEWFELWDEGDDGFGETMVRSLDRFLVALDARSAGTR